MGNGMAKARGVQRENAAPAAGIEKPEADQRRNVECLPLMIRPPLPPFDHHIFPRSGASCY